ncbi:MAG: hypothetical protein MHPSP_000681, partial [Paramarteilia canceri]
GIEYINKNEFKRYKRELNYEKEIMEKIYNNFYSPTNDELFESTTIIRDDFVRLGNEELFNDDQLIILPVINEIKQTKPMKNVEKMDKDDSKRYIFL